MCKFKTQNLLFGKINKKMELIYVLEDGWWTIVVLFYLDDCKLVSIIVANYRIFFIDQTTTFVRNSDDRTRGSQQNWLDLMESRNTLNNLHGANL